MSNISPLKGVNADGSPYIKVYDNLSKKSFNSTAELLKYYDI
nr:MAG TPA: hypothetical protein [Caudoviricetes sp.]